MTSVQPLGKHGQHPANRYPHGAIFHDSLEGEVRNVAYQGAQCAGWYIRNFAGGFQKNADRNSVTVTYPNNKMVATKRFLIFFRGYPTVVPGSTITLKMDENKVKESLQPKEKMDFETTVSKTLSVLTLTLSIILFYLC